MSSKWSRYHKISCQIDVMEEELSEHFTQKEPDSFHVFAEKLRGYLG